MAFSLIIFAEIKIDIAAIKIRKFIKKCLKIFDCFIIIPATKSPIQIPIETYPLISTISNVFIFVYFKIIQ